jgi:ketosteroid isomerase-like protein
MPTPDAKTFSQNWVDAWNAHDIEAVLEHFRDDVAFTSPVAVRVLPETGGVVAGKDALRHYWTTALSRCRICTSRSSTSIAANPRS